MFAMVAFALGLVMIVTAAKVDRAARARSGRRAIVLNLAGVGCLLLGAHLWGSGTDQPAAFLQADHGARLFAQRPRAIVVPLNAHGFHGHVLETKHVTDAGHGMAAETASAVRDGDPPTASESAPVTNDTLTAEQPAEVTPLEEPPAEGEGTGEDVPLEIRSKVEIDFEARPSWVDRADVELGDVHYTSVASGPYLRPREARRELYQQIERVTDEYINELLRHPRAARWVGYEAKEIRQRFLAPDGLYEERVLSPSFGVMHQVHALLAFDESFHDEVERAWHRTQARAQLIKVALAAAIVLGMLALVFNYFRMDTATRGFYSGRLKFATAGAILAVIAAGFFLARAIPWLWL